MSIINKKNNINRNIFSDLITALVTPFKHDQIDIDSFLKLMKYQFNNDVRTVVVGGSTGEFSTMSRSEYLEILKNAVQYRNSHNLEAKIIAGCGYNDTKLALEMVEEIQKINVDGIMCTVPSYNKPTQNGLHMHFKSIHDASSLPIMIYTVPSRTGIDLEDNTMIQISHLERVYGIKDASGKVQRVLRIQDKIKSGCNILSGDDQLTLSFYSHGAKGLVSVASNLLPKKFVLLCQMLKNNQFKDALLLQTSMLNLYSALSCESNPIPVKYALSKIGICRSDVRMPLCEPSLHNKKMIENALNFYFSKEKI